MSDDLCAVCAGSGNIVTFRHGLQFWRCHYCGGSGVRIQDGPREIRSGGQKK